MLVNNFPKRKYIEAISTLSYSFRNAQLINVVVHSITLFYKGLAYDLRKVTQFNYAQNRINISFHPDDFLPIKKCVFHLQIAYSLKGDDIVNIYNENIKFIPRMFKSIKDKPKSEKKDDVPKIQYRDVDDTEAEERLVQMIKDALTDSTKVWRDYGFDSKIEIAIVIHKSKKVYLTKEYFDKVITKEINERMLKTLMKMEYFKRFAKQMRTTKITVLTDNKATKINARAFQLTDKFIIRLKELGIELNV